MPLPGRSQPPGEETGFAIELLGRARSTDGRPIDEAELCSALTRVYSESPFEVARLRKRVLELEQLADDLLMGAAHDSTLEQRAREVLLCIGCGELRAKCDDSEVPCEGCNCDQVAVELEPLRAPEPEEEAWATCEFCRGNLLGKAGQGCASPRSHASAT